MMGRLLRLLVAVLVSHSGLAATWPARAPARSVARRTSFAGRRVCPILMAAAKQSKKKGGKPAAKASNGFGAGSEAAPSNGAKRKAAAPDGVDANGMPAPTRPLGPPGSPRVSEAVVGGERLVTVDAPELREAQWEASKVSFTLFGNDPFMRIQPEQWEALRLPRASSNEAVLQGVLDAVSRGQLDDFVRVNRDYVIKRFQLWMMAESFRQKKAGDEAASNATRAALTSLIVSNRNFDAPLAVAVDKREKALNAAFEQASQPEESKPTIVDLAGEGPLEQLGFWVVIASAKEAWCERLLETDKGDQRLRQAMARKVGQMDQFLEAIQLTPEIQVEPIPVLLSAMLTNEVEVGVVSDQLVFRLGCILGCIECLRYAAFSALARRLSVLMDIVAAGEVKPIDLGPRLVFDSEIEKAKAEGTVSNIIVYEETQEAAEKTEVTVKLGNFLSDKPARQPSKPGVQWKM